MAEESLSLSFEEFYYSGFTSEQNAEVLRRILRSEHFAHFLSEEKTKEIKTKKELEHVYNRILQRANNHQRPNNLIITEEKRIKAEKSLLEKAEKREKKTKFIQKGYLRPSFLFFKIMIR